jgi:hypothetical protein
MAIRALWSESIDKQPDSGPEGGGWEFGNFSRDPKFNMRDSNFGGRENNEGEIPSQ